MAPTATTADGTFRPTEAQWGALELAVSEGYRFRSEFTTEGKIAVDEDHSTPIFSPYAGRVTKLLAKPGDHVVQGQPLFVVEADEYDHSFLQLRPNIAVLTTLGLMLLGVPSALALGIVVTVQQGTLAPLPPAVCRRCRSCKASASWPRSSKSSVKQKPNLS